MTVLAKNVSILLDQRRKKFILHHRSTLDFWCLEGEEREGLKLYTYPKEHGGGTAYLNFCLFRLI